MPTVTDIAPLKQLLAHLTPGEPIRHQPLTCVPLLAEGLDDPDWLTLDEAGNTVAITEITEDGLVPESVTNERDHPLMLDGEELVGAKQNRVLNTTVLVAARIPWNSEG